MRIARLAALLGLSLFMLAIWTYPARGDAPVSDDSVAQDLQTAKAAHAAALDKANAAMMQAFDDQISALGLNQPDVAQSLTTQKSAFVSAGIMPASPLMANAVTQYQQAMHSAESDFSRAYDTVVDSYTSNGDFDKAVATRREQRGAAPPVPDQGDSALPITPRTVAAQLEQGKQSYQKALDDAKQALVNTIDQRINDATAMGDLNGVETLQAAKATAVVDGSVSDGVKDAAVVAARRHYLAAVKTATALMARSYENAIRDFTRTKDFAKAKATQNEYVSSGFLNATDVDFAEGAYQLGSTLPAFLASDRQEFFALPKRLGILVPDNIYIRTRADDFLAKDFTCDVWFYMVQDVPNLPAAYIGIGDGTPSLTDNGPAESLYLHIFPPDKSDGEVRLHNRTHLSHHVVGHLKEFDTYIARIQKSGDSVTFSIGIEESGKFVPEVTTTVDNLRKTAPYLNDANTHLFFGAGAFRQICITSGSAAPKVPVATVLVPGAPGTKPDQRATALPLSSLPPVSGAVGSSTVTNSIGIKLVRIQPGTFMMGSPEGEQGRGNDETRHKVTLTQGFFMGATHVTVGQFAEFVDDTGYKTDGEKQGSLWCGIGGRGWVTKNGLSWKNPGFIQDANCPVVGVSWNDASAFCKWLSRKENKHFRLPTMAEWEYCCRAGTQHIYSFGDDSSQLGEYAWFQDNSGGQTHPVGQKKPNAWGLYDMQGNALEWSADFPRNLYTSEDAVDPHGAKVGKSHDLHGGSWLADAQTCRCADRLEKAPTHAAYNVGFRVVMDDGESISNSATPASAQSEAQSAPSSSPIK